MYILGEHWKVCDRCGMKFRKSQTRRTWDGLIVCFDDWEVRHPQDFVRGVEDDQSVKDARPRQTDRFVGTVTADDL